MIKYYIDNELCNKAKSSKRFSDLSDEEHVVLYDELCNATLHNTDKDILALLDTGFSIDSNPVNSLLMWVLGIYNSKPNDFIIIDEAGSLPDIDTDYSKINRGRVIDYYSEKYGADKVAQIGTFGTLGARGAIRASARVLGYQVADGDYLAKQIPFEPDITINTSIENNDLLKDILATKEEPYWSILDTALKLEGLPQSLGLHASGLILADKPIYEYVPLMISKKDGGGSCTQFEFKDCESNFLCKLDILGLKTLDVIAETCKLVKQRHGINIIPNDINVNDKSIYKLLLDGYNTLVFQFESAIFAAAVQKVKPSSIHDLSAITSLNRPGPMSNGLLDRYIDAKNNGNLYDYELSDKNLIAKVQDICSDCYSIMTYQEYVIRCFMEIGGFDEVGGDSARKALGKKDAELLESLGKQFVLGGVKKGYKEADLEKLFQQIQLFSGYSFNSSHAYSYSHLSAQSAWLSANYPIELYAAALSIDSGNMDDIRVYIKGAKDRGIKILPPRINKSSLDFVIVDDSIVFGLSAIKGVGKAVTSKIISNRPKKTGYTSFGHFIVKNLNLINKKVLDSYCKAGVFEEFGLSKNTILSSIEGILDFISTIKNGSSYTIFDLFDIDIASFVNQHLIKISYKKDDPYYECEGIGLYISNHPMEEYLVNTKKTNRIRKLLECDLDTDSEFGIKCKVTGVVSGIDIRKTKSKMNMCEFQLTDIDASINCVVFPKAYAENINEIVEGKIVTLEGNLKMDSGNRTMYPKKIELWNGNQEYLMRKIDKSVECDIIIHKINDSLSFKLQRG